MLKIITWNINSIRARLDSLNELLIKYKPDILLLQETKVQDHQFPHQELSSFCYNIKTFGQKSYNGVAILSKYPIEDVVLGIPGFLDTAARYIEVFTHSFRIASVYVPNGESLDSPKFDYKMEFLNYLYKHCNYLLGYGEKTIIAGDFNIAPSDIDTYDVIKFQNRLLCSLKERKEFRKLLNLGFVDGLRTMYPYENNLYTWWDYRKGSWDRDDGLRIDHCLLSPMACNQFKDCIVARDIRGLSKPSDHAPVIAFFEA